MRTTAVVAATADAVSGVRNIETSAAPSSSPDTSIPSAEAVHQAFEELLALGVDLKMPVVDAAQHTLRAVVQEHTRLLAYVQTHGRSRSLAATEGREGAFNRSPHFTAFAELSERAVASLQISAAAALQQQRAVGSPSSSAPTSPWAEGILQCLLLLLQSLEWVLQPASPAADPSASLEKGLHQLRLYSEQTLSAVASSSTTSRTSSFHETTAVKSWLRQADAALSTLCRFVLGTYPHGVWFANLNRCAVMRRRQARHPSDVGEGPFAAVVDAAIQAGDEDIVRMSTVLLWVAQAYAQCLAQVRATVRRPADPASLAAIFTPLNTSLNELTATCEDVISQCEENRLHAHAILEAGNIFTWLSTEMAPCAVVEEAFGSTNVNLSKIVARGKVLLLQMENGLEVKRPDFMRAMLTWAGLLREALEQLQQQVQYRYPLAAPWGELLRDHPSSFLSAANSS